MKYVRIECTNDVNVYKYSDRKHCLVLKTTLIPGELLTEKELHRILFGADLDTAGHKLTFEPVELKKDQVYTSFGCRFQIH